MTVIVKAREFGVQGERGGLEIVRPYKIEDVKNRINQGTLDLNDDLVADVVAARIVAAGFKTCACCGGTLIQRDGLLECRNISGDCEHRDYRFNPSTGALVA